MADVTVLGAGGATVTLVLSSAQNAAIAQAAVGSVTKLVEAGTLAQQNFTGSPLGTPPGLLGGVVVESAGNVGGLTSQYVSAMVAAAGNSTIVGPQNFTSTVVATDGANLTYWNQSTAAQIFLGAGDNFLINSGGAIAFFDKGASVIQTEAGGTTTAVVQDDGLVLVQGAGKTTVAAADGADVVVAVQGDSTVPVTVTGGGAGGNIQYLAIGGKGIINPGAANVTVFGNVGGGTATVFGGTGPVGTDPAPEFTGKLTVVEGSGFFQGGTGGGNLLFSSTVAGSATLVGGGDGDQLFSMGANQFLLAGAGSSTLTGFNVDATVGGSIFQSGGGNATIFGNTGGGNTFAIGGGLTAIDGRDEAAITAAGATAQANTFYVVAAAGGGAGVGDFVSGLDTFNLTLTTSVTGQTLSSLEFFAAGASGSPFGDEGGTRMTLSGGTIVDFFGTAVKATDIV
jgi:hypothetical protein